MKIHQAMISIPHPRQITESIMHQVISWTGVRRISWFLLLTEECQTCSAHPIIASELKGSHLPGAPSLALPHKVLVTWSCCCGESFTVEDGVMVWVDESSSVGEKMTVSSHKVGNLSTGRVRKTHCLATAWWLSFTALLYLMSTRYLIKAHLLHCLEHTVCASLSLSFQLLFLGLTKFHMHRVRKVRCAA